MLISVLVSFMKGFVKDFLSLFAWIGAAIATLYFYPFAASFMEGLFKSSRIVNITAIISAYVISLSALSLINSFIYGNLKEFQANMSDKVLGIFFGLFKGFVIISATHFIIITIAEKEPDWLVDGETYELTKRGSDIITNLSQNYLEKGKEVIEEQGQMEIEDITE